MFALKNIKPMPTQSHRALTNQPSLFYFWKVLQRIGSRYKTSFCIFLSKKMILPPINFVVFHMVYHQFIKALVQLLNACINKIKIPARVFERKCHFKRAQGSQGRISLGKLLLDVSFSIYDAKYSLDFYSAIFDISIRKMEKNAKRSIDNNSSSFYLGKIEKSHLFYLRNLLDKSEEIINHKFCLKSESGVQYKGLFLQQSSLRQTWLHFCQYIVE